MRVPLYTPRPLVDHRRIPTDLSQGSIEVHGRSEVLYISHFYRIHDACAMYVIIRLWISTNLREILERTKYRKYMQTIVPSVMYIFQIGIA